MKTYINNKPIDDNDLNFIENKFGILSLSGEEEIFALDGQHRLVGLRDAFKKDESIGEEEISLIYVIHNSSNIERTRRLFTVWNRYAEKPKQAELIILEEDDVAAINTRKLVSEHKVLSLKGAISNSKSGGIANNDFDSFTTLVTVYNINKILYSKNSDFYTVRPSDESIASYYDISVKFWDFFFESFPYITDFIKGRRSIEIDGNMMDRNNETGGSLLRRPVGQQLIAKIYSNFKGKNRIDFLKENISKIDFNLSGKYFRYLYWNDGKMLSKNMKLKQNLLFYLLGAFDNEEVLHKELEDLYKGFNVDYDELEKIVE